MWKTSYDLARWQGYMTEAEVDVIHDIAEALLPNAVVVKIGAGAGTESVAVMEVNEDCTIFSIDILCCTAALTTNEHLRLAESEYGARGQVIRIWGDSVDVCKRWPMKIDWLHVDGDHTERGIRGDVQGWLGHVNAGGYVSFHDYGSPTWPDVKTVVDELMADHEVFTLVDCLKVFRKV